MYGLVGSGHIYEYTLGGGSSTSLNGVRTHYARHWGSRRAPLVSGCFPGRHFFFFNFGFGASPVTSKQVTRCKLPKGDSKSEVVDDVPPATRAPHLPLGEHEKWSPETQSYRLLVPPKVPKWCQEPSSSCTGCCTEPTSIYSEPESHDMPASKSEASELSISLLAAMASKF